MKFVRARLIPEWSLFYPIALDPSKEDDGLLGSIGREDLGEIPPKIEADMVGDFAKRICHLHPDQWERMRDSVREYEMV